MLNQIVEDSLRNIEGHDRFKLLHEAVKLAKSAPSDIKEKPIAWALQMIAEGRYAESEKTEND